MRVSVRFEEELFLRNNAHTIVRVRVGPRPGSRALAGSLTLRTEEWDALRTWLEQFSGREAQAGVVDLDDLTPCRCYTLPGDNISCAVHGGW